MRAASRGLSGRVLALLGLAATSDCTCHREEAKVGQIDGLIRARVAEVKTDGVGIDVIGRGHVGIILPARQKKRWCELQVERPFQATLELRDDCSPPYRLQVDPAGRRVAVRPEAAAAGQWELLYLGTGERSFPALQRLPLSVDVDWATVPTLVDVLEPLYRAQRSHPEADAVVDEVRASQGDEGLGAFLARVADVRTGTDASVCPESFKHDASPWANGVRSLREPGRAAWQAGCRALLAQSEVSPLALGRAFLALDLDGDAELDLAERWLRARPPDVSSEAWSWMIRRLARRRPAVAGALACADLSLYTFNGHASEMSTDIVQAELAAVAFSQTRCPAVAVDRIKTKSEGYCALSHWFESRPEEVPRRRFTAAGVTARVKAQIDADAPAAREQMCARPNGNVLAARLAQGPLDPAFERALERFTYPIERPERPLCLDLTPADAGKPCWLPEGGLQRDYSCMLGPQVPASYVTPDQSLAIGAIRFDDRTRTARLVRSSLPLVLGRSP